jgi:ureidoacrylate peracid hydrolase
MPKFLTEVDVDKTAVIVVDMTNGFCEPGAPVFVEMGYELAPKLGDFLETCRDSGIMALFTTHLYRADGSDMSRLVKRRMQASGPMLIEGTHDVEIYPVCGPREDEIVIKKHFFSSFYGTDLDTILTANGIKTLVITGVCTDICCFATARDAMCYGYDVVFPADLTGTYEHPDCGAGKFTARQYHVATLNNLAATNADVMESDAFLSMIPQGSYAK